MHVIDEYAKARYPVLSSMRGQYLTHINKVSELSQKQGNELVNKQVSNNSSVLDVVATVAPSQCSCTLAIMVVH